ncbi:MAG: CHAT domain-containing protein [Gammaproteobacteria bacterium]
MINFAKYLMVFAVACCAGAHAAEPMLEVEYGNCAAVLIGPRCVLNDAGSLRLWVRAAPGATLTVDNGRRSLDIVQQFAVDGGTHFQVQVPPRSRKVRIIATDAGTSREWSIELASATDASELAEVKRLFGGGEYDAAEALILQLIAQESFVQPGSAHRLAGIFYHNRGAPEKARDYYTQAIDLCLREGRWLEAVKAASALSYLLQHTFRDFAAARIAYARFAGIENLPAEARYFKHYDVGLLGFNTGNRRMALTQLEQAARQALRMGSTGRWQQRQLDAEEVLASQLQRLGRRADARAYFDAWQTRDLSNLAACERAYFYSNAAWNKLLILEAGDQTVDPTAELEQALIIMREDCKPSEIANGEINLALAHYHAGRLDAADEALKRARAAIPTPDLGLRFWDLDIGARLAAARGETQVALALLDGMSRLANATLSPDAAWRAAARRGVILEQLGRHDDALQAYTQADAQLENDLQSVPFYAGRGQFSANREWVMRRRLSLLHAGGAIDEMTQLIRTSQRRAFSALASQSNRPQRDRALAKYESLRTTLADQMSAGWRVPADELAQLQARQAEHERELRELLDQSTLDATTTIPLAVPPPGEALLIFHPLVQGWVAIAMTGDTSTAVTPACALEHQTPAALAQCLIDALAPNLHAAKRLRVVPSGVLAEVDFHALKFADTHLMDALPLRYSLDLHAAVPPVFGGTQAFIVGDPTRQLPASKKEALAVGSALSNTGLMAVQTLTGRDAGFEPVRSALNTADIFHFAGHATYESQHAWSSALALASDDALSVADVLSLERVPAFVMLSACDTARGDASVQGEVVGLAQAFALRGAQAVIATARPVRDEQAQALSRAFYHHWHGDLPADIALQRAQQSLRQLDPDGDWAAFRLISN